MPDYGEIFCTAVNEIVKQQLGQIKFDLTKDCTVVSVQNKKNFEYLVSDGSNTFKAYATAGVTYAEGDQVMVSIPEGDYSKQKTIINKIVSDDSSIGYKDPLEDFIAGSGNIIQIAEVNKLTANGVDANGKSVAVKSLFTLDDSQSNLYFGFTKLALTAEFMTLLDNLGVITGQYGLKLLITDVSGASAELTFSASEMLGNPYAFNTYFKQVCVFDLPDSIKDIQKIELLFYQDGNFTTDGRTLISNKLEENILVKNINVILGFSSSAATSEVVTISANNMSYSFNDNVRYPTLQWFHLIDTGVFEPINSSNWEEKKNYCEIRWYQYKPGCAEGDTDEYGGANWYWLNQPSTLVGMPANYPFSYPITLSPNNDYEQIKVVTLYTTFPLQNDPDYKQILNYTSNILEFQNKTESSNGGTQTEAQIVEDLSLFFTDNSYGNYFWYDQNGSLIDLANQGSAIPRTVEIRAKGATLDSNWESYDLIDWIKWEMPMDDDSTMILPAKNMEFFNPADNILNLLNQDGLLPEEKKQYCHPGDFHFKTKIKFGSSKSSVNKVKIILETYVNGSWDAPGNHPLSATLTTNDEEEKEFYTVFKIKRTYDDLRIKYEYYKDNVKVSSISPTVSETELKQTSSFIASTKTKEDGIFMYYSIKDKWTQYRDNNTIQCTISINGVPYILTETLRFGTKGSSGTANTFLLEMLDGKNALIINDDNDTPNKLRVQAMLIGGNGKRIVLSDSNKIEWSLINGNEKYMTLQSSGDLATLTAKTESLPVDNYTILQAKYKYSEADGKSGSNPWLYAFLPIPMKIANCIGMQGTTQIIYNHQGVPQYSDTPYIAFYNNDTKDDLKIQENKTWELKMPMNEDNTATTNPNPVILERQSVLRAAPLYSKNEDATGIIQDRACVYCGQWSQPILIIQSQYDFAMLNEWNGKLETDEENGTILATMLGAGKKDSNNKFSGVLIGDLQTGTKLENTETMTGVYGFEKGILSYGLRENGSAFFGAAKNGRVEINGEHGAIHSYGWIPTYQSDSTSGNKWTRWDLSKEVSSGSVFDLDDGQLQLYASDSNYFKYNNNNSGKIEMALSGADIKLNDKTNNPGLSAYIDANAKKMVVEYRRKATYTVSCDTPDGTAIKKLDISDFQYNDDFKSDKADEANKVTEIAVDDILQNGVTVAVTFTKGETVKAEPIQTKENDATGRSNPAHTGSKIKYTGQALSLSIDGKQASIWINGKPTNGNASLVQNAENKWVKNENSNYFGWVSGSTVYFTYVDGHWNVTDSGSYSQTVQTADTIYNEVSQIGGSLSSSIKQTAASIESEVRRYAGYVGTCDTSDGTNTKIVVLKNAPTTNFKMSSLLQEGIGLAVKFTKKQSVFDPVSKQIKLQIQLPDGKKDDEDKNTTSGVEISLENGHKFSWTEYSTIYFVYTDGYWQVTDAGNYSRITQTADAIVAEVKRKAQYYGICETDDGVVFNEDGTFKKFNTTNAMKKVALENLLKSDPANNIKETPINATDLYQTGVTIAVTFTNKQSTIQNKTEHTNTSNKVDEDISYEYNDITYTTTGQGLSLYVSNLDTTTNPTLPEYPIFIQKNQTAQDNKNKTFGWAAGSTIYFTFNSDIGGWLVSDSGSYSKITETADMIKAEVKTLDGKYGSAITQTAKQIRLEVNQKANYTAICETVANAPTKTLVIKDVNKLITILDDKTKDVDCVILIKFTNENTVTTDLKFKINDKYSFTVTSNPKWEAEETLPFRLYSAVPLEGKSRSGSFTLTSLSNSKITQLATSIKAEVLEQNGKQSEGFCWALTKSGFALQSVLGKTEPQASDWKTVLNCTRDAFTLDVEKLKIKSNPSSTNENYLFVGNNDKFLKYTQSGNLVIKGDITATSLTIADTVADDAGLVRTGNVISLVDGQVTAKAIEIKNTSNTTIFKASGNSVSMAGWTVDSNSIRYGTLGSKDSMWLCRDGTTTKTSVGGSGEKDGWCIAVGTKFGVDEEGNLYCNGGTFKGSITGASGKFGNWTINSSGIIYGNKNTSDANGYVELDNTELRYRPASQSTIYATNWGVVAKAWNNVGTNASVFNTSGLGTFSNSQACVVYDYAKNQYINILITPLGIISKVYWTDKNNDIEGD